jgi:excinuclease ABC subunit A
LGDNEDSATAKVLRTSEGSSAVAHVPRSPSDWITLKQVNYRNLQDLTVRIPLGVLCVIAGPGGSGKSSLLQDILVPLIRHRLDPTAKALDPARCRGLEGGESITELAVVDRTPLTRSSRSNAATWIDVFDDIREVFAMSSEAKQRGFGPQHFSFNAAQGGRCRACRGTGVFRHDMQFLPDVTLTCPECGGTRYRREILDVKYRGRSIADVLAMSATEAATFFRNHSRLQSRLQMLKQIGLDYLVLGQPTDTLSGGEAQRLKLAARLTTGRGPTLIVCDEATVGLHPLDVERLADCFDELLAIGHSIVVIDNSPDLIRRADHVIELA